ncbi:MAG: DNA polymerase III subunit alpha [Rhodospirillales bacterium]|nr:DNA polymerase III subunit alpha [Rhodospirillales bacterium]
MRQTDTLAGFVHLRVHTAYSLSEGAIRVKDLARLCVEHRMPAVAMTDTNNLFGGMEFSTALREKGVQPIIGCQLAVVAATPAARPAPGRAQGSPSSDPLVLLVQSAQGYTNLLRLLAHAYGPEDAAASEPCVPLDVLCAHAGGLILLTGGPDGPVGRLLLDGRREAADALLERLHDAFGDRLYVELMRHGLQNEAAIEPALLAMAQHRGLPICATNEAYFTTPELYEAHDARLCISQGVHLDDANRRRLTVEHGFKSAAEMRALFSDLPDAADNTLLIARRCAFAIETVKPMLPPFDCGPQRSEDDVVREMARLGLAQRLAALSAEGRRHSDDDYQTRLAFELDVICKMGFAGYFLIVAEFIGWAKEQGIPVGPGRGSGAGSVVAWSLRITDLDPLRFGLLFERFLNPERVSMPDFDIDFCQDRRDEVIRHVHAKYGAERVAQIITFGKLQARAVLRDVGRVMGLPYGQVDRICKLVPNNPANPVTLDGALKVEPQLQAMVAEDETIARLVDIARKLEGLYRHASTHAAGVVISERALMELIPLYRDARSELLVTGFNMKWVEQAGLVKFDFLGLKTLTVLAQTIALIREGGGPPVDLACLPLDDTKTFAMLGRGDTVGVFQLESSGMRDVLRKMKPDTFEDIIAVVALYRPGPMDNIPSYIRRKHGDEEADYLYPSLEPILRETYGIMIYQEQVMQIAQELSGYSLGGADLLRRAMGKKIKEEMDKQRTSFVAGAVGRGVGEAKASHIFDLVAKFAGYGFNKSHAAAYALIAYQTAWLKANYPLEFFAASMTFDLANSDKLNGFRQELNRLGIRLLPPDINASEATFSVERIAGGAKQDGQADGNGPDGEGAIRYALTGIKTVGEPAARALAHERRRGGPFTSLTDFARRLGGLHLNKRQIENLARAGAFTSLSANRRQVHDSVEAMLRCASASASERNDDQIGLFGGAAFDHAPRLQVADVADWPPMERLAEELEAVGFYLSAHPLDTWGARLKRLKVVRYADLVASGRSGAVLLAGTVISRKERTSSKGSKYAFVQLSDTSGVFEVTVFSELLASERERLVAGASLLLHATAQVEGDAVRCVVQRLEALDQVMDRLAEGVEIYVDSVGPLPRLREALAEAPAGRGQIRLIPWLGAGREVEIVLPGTVRITGALVSRLRAIAGVRDVREA